MTLSNNTWYEQMGAAMRDREKALAGVERWQSKVREAELAIAVLNAKPMNLTPSTTEAPEPEPVVDEPFANLGEFTQIN